MGKRIYRKISKNGRDDLIKVVTVGEAAKLYSFHPETIRMAMDAGKLCYRPTLGGHFLITVKSLKALYGDAIIGGVWIDICLGESDSEFIREKLGKK